LLPGILAGLMATAMMKSQLKSTLTGVQAATSKSEAPLTTLIYKNF
jgi:hypothetical protein